MKLFDVAPKVRAALKRGKPVVALESTIVSHGMPYPRNIETARALEQIVVENGAVPATIAIVRGRIRIGIDEEALHRLASGGHDVRKLSRADLPAAIASGEDGATTVAATMLCAHRAGIRVFATGGIGGVHRNADRTFDISADLYELAQTPVTVVCSGAKALLDLPKTLELLESLGVPVIAYGSDEFPAFWSRESGLRAPLRLDDAESIARFVRIQRALDLKGGAVVANPIPASHEIPRAVMERAIEAAVRECEERGVAGKEVTPWLLDRLNRLTEGKSLEANIALVKENARLAAALARELA